jgi:hypothetical protein
MDRVKDSRCGDGDGDGNLNIVINWLRGFIAVPNLLPNLIIAYTGLSRRRRCHVWPETVMSRMARDDC